jgi:hypothetical protein
MGKSTPSAPQSANASQVAQEQSQANVKTAVAQSYLNNVNQTTPYGSLTYTPDYNAGTNIDGQGVPQWTAATALNPAGQKLQDTTMAINQGTADLANQYVGRIAQATAQPYSYDGLGPAPTYDPSSADKATQTLISRNQPQMDRDLASLNQRLANQGISVGSPAYQAAMDQYQRSVNDFRLGAETQGQQYAMNDYNTSENAYQNAIQQMTNLRTQPINEVAALMGTGTGVQQPSFVNAPQTQIAPTDVIGAYNSANQAQMAQYMMGMQQNAATTAGLFGLGGTLGAAAMQYGPKMFGSTVSDERVKTDIEPVGALDNGLTVYRFRYKGDPTPQIGLMAQEVEQTNPDAVQTLPSGLKLVDYGSATSRPSKSVGGLFALGAVA